MAGNLKHLLKHTGVYLIGNVLNRLGAFILLPIYTNYLSVPEYGVLEILYSINAVLSVLFGAGLAHATLRFYFDYEDQKNRNSVVTTNLLITFVSVTVGVLLVNVWSEEVTLLLLDDLQFELALQIALMIIVVELSSEVLLAYLRAQERSGLYVILSAVRLVAQIGVTYYLLVNQGGSVDAVLTSNLISVSLIAAILLVFTLKECGFRIDLKKVKPILKYSIPFAASSIVGVVSGNADRFFLKEFEGFAEVGVYGLAMKFALLLTFVLAEPLYKSYGPYRFSLIGKPGAELFHASVAKYLTFAAVFVALALSLFISDLLRLLSAPEYWAAAGIVPILLLGVIVQTNSYCFQTGILIHKKSQYILYIIILSTSINLLMNALMVVYFELGGYGAAIAYTCGTLTTALVTNLVSQRLYHVPYPFVKMAMVLLLGMMTYLFSLLIPGGVVWLSLLLKGTLLIAFFVLLYFLDAEVRGLIDKARLRFSAR